MKSLLLAAFLILGSQAAIADSTDDLLSTLTSSANSQTDNQAVKIKKITANLNDPMIRQLYVQIETTDNAPEGLRDWANDVFAEDWASAVRLWSATQPTIPENLRHTVTAAYLYSLWKLSLPQTFFSNWIKNVSNPEYLTSRAESALEAAIAPSVKAWLVMSGLIVNEEEKAVLAKLPSDKNFVTSINAWLALEKPDQAEKYLPLLPTDTVLRLWLGQEAMLYQVHKNDLGAAAKILKRFVEPTVEALRNTELLAQHNMNIARILFQANQLKAAQTFYEKIPNGSPLFLKAREELAWTYLKGHDLQKLRGELEVLNLPIFNERFYPETLVVRGISNLKMCFYDRVQKDIETFNKINGVWAKKIDQALASTETPAPEQPDFRTKLSQSTISSIESEIQKLGSLNYHGELQAVYESAKRQREINYRRQWNNQRVELSSAIQKMRFVKVELFNQLNQETKRVNFGSSNLVASNGNVAPTNIEKEKDQISFPIQGEIWSDELFKLRSAAQSRCLKSKELK